MTRFIVEKQKVRSNIDIIKKKAGQAAVYAVLKSNAYGLGLDWMTAILLERGIRRFAVSGTDDALRVRTLSGEAEILLLNPVNSAEELMQLIEHRITVTVSSARQAAFITDICVRHGAIIRAHVEIETGMGRYGFMEMEFEQLVALYKNSPGILVTGIYSHVYNAANAKHTRKQIAAFSCLLDKLKAAGIQPGTAHLASSYVLFHYPQALFDAVRIGSAFTGRLITGESFGLQKVGTIESSIAEIRTLKKGQNVGYGGVFRVKKETKAAVIPAGLSSGFGLEKRHDLFRFRDFLSFVLHTFINLLTRNSCFVSINGSCAPIVGRIGMNHIVVDISGIDCAVGDKVHLEGNPMISGNLNEAEYLEN